jgi:hypothetical protein
LAHGNEATKAKSVNSIFEEFKRRDSREYFINEKSSNSDSSWMLARKNGCPVSQESCYPSLYLEDKEFMAGDHYRLQEKRCKERK